MLRPRIIPCLLVHDGGLVKTVRFKSPQYVGDPINAVKIFNEKEADELVLLDIDATVQNREPSYDMIAQIAAECRMPLCYGGGVKTPSQARQIIGLGVEKVAISAAAIESAEVVGAIANEIGRQSVVTVIDVRKKGLLSSDYISWTHNATRNSGRSAVDLAREFADRGAGEIVVNSIDLDGTMGGYDLNLARRIRAAVTIPITFIGGAGSLQDVSKLFQECGIVGASAGSLFVFKGAYRAVLINYPSPAQKEQIVGEFVKTNL